jgi:hypothetical protein
MPKICDFETCRKYANYGEHYGKPLRCRTHKEEYILVSQLCQEGNCKSRPNFNYEGETRKIYCFEHKKENMVDIKHKICTFENCKTRASCNYENETTPIYCATHKEKNMVALNTIFCNFENCKTRPTYNYENETNPIYCSKHKKNNMVNVKSSTCCELNCKKSQIYNYENEKKPLYCFEHKKNDMVNVVGKRCEFPFCKIRAAFNYIDKNMGIFCATHKKNDMVDVKSKKCIYEDCSRQPSFNYINQSAIYCSFHKKNDMVDVNNKKCKANLCLGTSGNPKYKGYCTNCYQHLFPLDTLTYQIRSKTKEICTRDYINENFKGFQHDKPLYTGNCNCTHRRRIDHRVLIGNTLLCVETDEGQHKDYNKKDEEIRYDDLFMIHSGKFVFIRFNPDKYINKNNKSVNPMLYTRLPILKEEIEKQLDRIKNEENTELLEIIKLYYDGYN